MPRRCRKTPKLIRLKFGTVYCENCRGTIEAGDVVAWWRVPGLGGRKRWAAYCSDCHHANVRHGHPIR